jgi:hypothetical protein
MGGACSAYGVGRDVYRVLTGKSKGKRPSCSKWESNIKADLLEVGCGLNWLRIGTGGGHL